MPGAAARGGAWQFEPLEKRILLSADPVQFLATLTDIDGDGVDEVIVGTHDAEQAGEQRGEVRVLSGADGSVLHTFAGEGQDSRFGWAVGDGGDLDGDGVHEIAVGAPGDGTLTFFSGSTGEVLVTLAGGQAGDGFGSSFAAAGDLNGDGYADWLVGVPGSDAASADGGEIQAVSGQWLADAASTDAGAGDYLLDVWSGAAPGVQVGSTLVALGDLDGDGDEDFAFGSAASGTLTLASWDNGGLQTQRVISGAGAVLAPVDDLDGDGIGDLLVGAPLAEGAGGEQAGSVTALSG
ncbi:MAG: FG-GAP-like repeat-containing protein, partial [Planctomycetota bacterium]|nr:FG-GAP-like repeat-containing protein [Planctomycetota bacterium]